jgi:hypothetical protein
MSMANPKTILFAIPLALTVACATLGPYDDPYALVEGGMRSAARKEFPVIVNAVDGETTFIPRRYPTPLKPGKHQIEDDRPGCRPLHSLQNSRPV